MINKIAKSIAAALTGAYPYMALPLPMAVNDEGDIYLTTKERGLIMLKKR